MVSYTVGNGFLYGRKWFPQDQEMVSSGVSGSQIRIYDAIVASPATAKLDTSTSIVSNKRWKSPIVKFPSTVAFSKAEFMAGFGNSKVLDTLSLN